MKTNRVRALSVETPQGQAGKLAKESRHVFAYKSVQRRCEVSLTMPIRAETYAATPMLPVFAMNRPEGYLLERIQRAFKHVQLDDMALLAITGSNQIGRLRYEELGRPAQSKRAEVGLSTLLRIGNEEGLFEYLVDTYLESGISGFQPKVMIPDADRTEPTAMGEKITATTPNLILKASGDDYPYLTVNEYLCMDAARRSGITVPKFWLSDDNGLFVMERFDLEGGSQLGFEDMAVLMGKNHTERNFKYTGSYEGIAKAIRLYCGGNTDESLGRFFEYFVLSVMVRNGDAHLKNFGLLYEHPASEAAPRLSPLFDVVTTSVYKYENQKTGFEVADRTMALKLNKAVAYPQHAELCAFGRNICHVSNPASVIERIADAMSATLAAQGARLPRDFLGALCSEWDAGRSAVEPIRVFVGEAKAPASD